MTRPQKADMDTSSGKRLYAVGFAFSPLGDKVVLIRKHRPRWQAGRLNGVGGHVEEGETPFDAMRREFREETGVWVHDWTHFATLNCVGGIVEFFSSSIDVRRVGTCTDEEVEIHSALTLPEDVVPELYWLIPMALHIGEDLAERIEMREIYEEMGGTS